MPLPYKPIVSVVMSVFNGGEYLEEAIESVLNQSFTDFEFIIIDDGSTDNSFTVIESYRKKDSRIISVSRQNKGLVSSLNEGFGLARGMYIARMDADDICLLDRLKEQVTFMENNINVGVCGSWALVFRGNGGKNKLLRHPATSKELKPRLLFSVCFAHPTVIMRASLLRKYNFQYSPLAINSEDYDLWTRIVEKTDIANVQKVLLKYRYVDTSISRLADNKKSDERYNQLKEIFTKELSKLGVVNSSVENKLHFIVSSNERIKKIGIDLSLLNIYFNKIISANKTSNYYNNTELTKLLSRKYLISFYYQVMKSKITILQLFNSKFLFLALLDLIKAKLSLKNKIINSGEL